MNIVQRAGLLGLALLMAGSATAAAQPQGTVHDAAMRPSADWLILGESPGGTPFTEIDGRPVLYMSRGIALLPNLDIKDGVVEADLKPAPGNKGFLGLAFRVRAKDNFELVYVRFGHSNQPDALQYDPYQNGSITWQLHPEEQAAAPLPADGWTHLRIVYHGSRAEIFVNDGEKPALAIPDLAEGNSRGGIGVFNLAGGGYVSNLKVTALPEEPYSAPPREFLAGSIRDWEISPSFDAKSIEPDRYPVKPDWIWRKVTADPPGILVINRLYPAFMGFPPSRDEILSRRATGNTVYLRTIARMSKPTTCPLALGYSDNVSLFVNGKHLYSGGNALGFREPTHAGRIGLNDEVTVSLHSGVNEIIVALSDFGGGWGLIAQLNCRDRA